MPAQVVSGVGFIGAGAILVARGRIVVGLTTAATIWAVAAIGLAVGAGAFTPAVAATAFVVLVLTALARLESAWFEPGPTEFLELDLVSEAEAIARVRETLAARGLRCRLSELEREGGKTRVLLEVRGRGAERDRILEELARHPDVRRAAVLAVRPSP
jgi:putative Mg2+ transporter-C (MgtC) family protein